MWDSERRGRVRLGAMEKCKPWTMWSRVAVRETPARIRREVCMWVVRRVRAVERNGWGGLGLVRRLDGG